MSVKPKGLLLAPWSIPGVALHVYTIVLPEPEPPPFSGNFYKIRKYKLSKSPEHTIEIQGN